MGELQVVAWMDDGQQAANGSGSTSFRVVTSETKASMPRAAVEAYTDPLVRLSDATARIAELEADRDSWAKQASDRVDDAVRFSAEWDAALAKVAEARREALEEAAKLVEAEAVEDTGHPGDDGYNMAIKHCAAAIRSAAYQGKEA